MNFLSSWVTTSFWRRSVLQYVSYATYVVETPLLNKQRNKGNIVRSALWTFRIFSLRNYAECCTLDPSYLFLNNRNNVRYKKEIAGNLGGCEWALWSRKGPSHARWHLSEPVSCDIRCFIHVLSACPCLTGPHDILVRPKVLFLETMGYRSFGYDTKIRWA